MERKAEDSSFDEVNEVYRFKVTLGRKCVDECLGHKDKCYKEFLVVRTMNL